tara:strand:+ start:23561 stop:24928 length:1368 start_codon:yes stop_codon:yes gene_type:complete
MELSHSEIKKLIDKHFDAFILSKKYNIRTIRANSLLTYNRFDLSFKLSYLELLKKNPSYSKELYRDHIRAFTLGKFKEPGNKNKNNLEKFYLDFNNTFNSIKKNNFDKKKSLVPITESGFILNGSHRVASAIFLNKSINTVTLNYPRPNYNYEFFKERNVSEKFLDTAVTSFIEHSGNTHIAFIWPSAIGNEKKLQKKLQKIVYKKTINLSINGAHNLISELYEGEKWLGDVENNFNGSFLKAIKCFNNNSPLQVYVFQAENLQHVVKIKKEIRELFNIGKHSIHITDTKKEAVKVSKFIFNNNSIHFFNNGYPLKFLSKKLDLKSIKRNGQIVFNEKMTLLLYGLKDYDVNIENLTSNINKYTINIHEGLYNPDDYFYFKNHKFLSLYKLLVLIEKQSLSHELDLIKDLRKLTRKQNSNKSYRQKIRYLKTIMRQSLVDILTKVGILKYIKKVI